MVSHVDILGALVYRTREALNKKVNGVSPFYTKVRENYKFYEAVFDAPNVCHLWHFPGTPQEITEAFNKIGKDPLAHKKLFPCVLNFQSLEELWGVDKDGLVQLDYDLAFCCLVNPEWTTEQRNRIVHRYVLEPIYDEFIRQVKSCGWFRIPMTGIKMNRMKVFTTGGSVHQALRTQYGWYFDSIQVTNTRLFLRNILCAEDIEQIEREATLVTDSILFNKQK